MRLDHTLTLVVLMDDTRIDDRMDHTLTLVVLIQCPPMNNVICGIDPGLGTTGYAVIRTGDFASRSPAGIAILDAGVCRFDRKETLSNRLLAIDTDIAAILDEHRPHIVAVEQLYAHYNHPRTAILMGHARGVILLAAARRNIEMQSYAATQVKRYLTGRGRADKAQVQRAVQVALGLPNLPDPPDVADALAIALCCAGTYDRVRMEASA